MVGSAIPPADVAAADVELSDALPADIGADALDDATALLDALPDAGSDILADIQPDAAPDIAPDIAADSTADIAPDVPVGPAVCQSDKDCTTAGKVCDPLTKLCVACLTDAECKVSEHCVGLQCHGFTACSNSLGCKAAKDSTGQEQPICDQTIGECSACLTAADCPASNDCKAKACVPFKTCLNSTECGKDQVCDKGASRCVQCLGYADCGPNELCEGGACKAFVACASDKQCTPLGLLCDGSKGKCAQCLQNSDCPAIYNCQKVGVDGTGLCLIDVCAQGQGACSNNAKVTCNAVGDGFGSPQACAGQTTCVAPGGKPACKAWLCQPGLNCDGAKAVACSDDGLEVLQSTDCGASAQKCFGGLCKTQICTPSASYCDGSAVKLCAKDGLSASVQKTCSASEFCGAGVCKAQVCSPGLPLCDGDWLKTCNAAGSGSSADAGQDCSATGQKCVGGACKTQVCKPATLFCEGSSLKTCAPDGLSVAKSVACGVGYFCGASKLGDAACLPVVCDPGQPTCNGSSAATCKADGSGFEAAQVDCKSSSKVCSAGVCVSLLCDPQTPAYCNGLDSMKCDATGLNPQKLQTCAAGCYCAAGACSKQICTPGGLSCAGNKPATCNADGSGYGAIGADCGVGKTCSAGVCIDAAPSCAMVLAANATATDGLYAIDPDGAGPIQAANLFCDMKNGGLTLVANVYDSAGDDAPNDTSYVVSGWQQTASGAWATQASTVDRAWGGGTGSAAVSLAFVQALGASAGQPNLKMCFVHQNGTDTVCRASVDGSLTLVSYATGNPKLTAYKDDKLTYTFGRLAGLAGSTDGYDPAKYVNQFGCIPRTPGAAGDFGTGTISCDGADGAPWWGWGYGSGYFPWAVDDWELRGAQPTTGNPSVNTYGFRIYVGP